MHDQINFSKMKIALAHDFLNNWGGGERVHLIFKEKLFPQADIFTLTYDEKKIKANFPYPVHTSVLQKLPGAVRHHKWYLPFLPWAVDSLDFSGYDLILSDCSGFIKGLTKPKGALHVCYLHTPVRYLHVEPEYFKETAPKFLHWVIPFLRARLLSRDLKDAAKPDAIISNSEEIARRTRKYYKREPIAAIFPPVDSRVFYSEDTDKKQDYFLVAGRLAPYKRFDLAIEACLKLGMKLVVVGTGAEEERWKKLAGASELITFTGKASDTELRKYYAEARAMIFPSLEDAGMTPLESMACGTPVIAYGEGGALESIIDGKTGVFFKEQTVESLCEAIARFDSLLFSKADCIAQASNFSEDKFVERIRLAITTALQNASKGEKA